MHLFLGCLLTLESTPWFRVHELIAFTTGSKSRFTQRLPFAMYIAVAVIPIYQRYAADRLNCIAYVRDTQQTVYHVKLYPDRVIRHYAPVGSIARLRCNKSSWLDNSTQSSSKDSQLWTMISYWPVISSGHLFAGAPGWISQWQKWHVAKIFINAFVFGFVICY